MSNKISFLIALGLISACSPQKKSNINIDLLPIEIVVESIGEGPRPGNASTIVLHRDSVYITTAHNQYRALGMAETEFSDILSTFHKQDFAGRKHYIKSRVEDGGRTTFISPYGIKKFTNVYGWGDFEEIYPDTIGVQKYERLVLYSHRMILDLMNQFHQKNAG